MHRKDHRQRLGDVVERGDRLREQAGIVDEVRAMESDEDVASSLEPELTPSLERERCVLVRSERVDHRVPDE